jgi:competence protein ComEC
MKPLQTIGIIICVSLVLSVAGCTGSKTNTQEKTSIGNVPITNQRTPNIANERPTSVTATTQLTLGTTSQNKEHRAINGNLTIHFIDVGQGDSILIDHGEDTMLIDSGEIGKGDEVASYIKGDGITSLDYVVATHPHSDHIGGMSVILNDFPIGHFIDSGYAYTSKTYEDMLTTIDKKNIPFTTPKRGNKIDFSSGIDVQVLNPGKSYFTDDLNQNSIVLKVTDGNVSFLLMGDVGIEAENEIMKDGYDVNADVLKVGHHGSRTSSGASFISAVSPAISVIEVGAENNYSHPHKETLDRLEKVSKVYRTDQDGTITITTDGSAYSVTTQKNESMTLSSTGSTVTGSTVYVSNLNLKDEWVKISNKESSPVSLSGWKIKDKGSKHTYTFPSYTLDSGATVTVYTEEGTNSNTELYWRLDGPIWNNNGDTAYLYDSSGKLVSSLER